MKDWQIGYVGVGAFFPLQVIVLNFVPLSICGLFPGQIKLGLVNNNSLLIR